MDSHSSMNKRTPIYPWHSSRSVAITHSVEPVLYKLRGAIKSPRIIKGPCPNE